MGTRIAVTCVLDGRSVIAVIDASGGNRLIVGASEGRAVDPNWSPDGSRLAYGVVTGPGGLIVVDRLDGSGPAVLARHDQGVPRSPIWLTGTLVAYALGSGEHAAVRVVNAFSGEPVAELRHSGLGRLIGVRRSAQDARWIESVRLRFPNNIVSPGQFIDVEPQITDAHGEPVSVGAADLTWACPMSPCWFT